MANEEHLKILNQGIEAWNQWRKKNPDIQPDLRRINLLWEKLPGADFSGADLFEADFSLADLSSASFKDAKLSRANFRRANLSGANLRGANLSEADFQGASLHQANLSHTYLAGVILWWADLSEAEFSQAHVVHTLFGDVDLSGVKGLGSVKHSGPSTIGIDTIYRSKGKIPRNFLKNAGILDSLINYIDETEDLYTHAVVYDMEQIEGWVNDGQKRAIIIRNTINDLEEKKALAGPIDVPTRVLNELREYQTELEKVEAEIIKWQKLKEIKLKETNKESQ